MGSAWKAVVFAAVVVGAAAVLRSWGVSLPMLLLAIGAASLVAGLALYGGRAVEGLLDAHRRWRWRNEEGRFHAFGGARLRFEDDGRHVWLVGEDLQRVLSTRDAEDVLAARHAGQWRRGDNGVLWLRVDSVVQRLATMPGRAEPRTVRLRRYLEREVLFPAGRRRQAARTRG
jgi:hypothetical protein